jgi:hypothetical protein
MSTAVRHSPAAGAPPAAAAWARTFMRSDGVAPAAPSAPWGRRAGAGARRRVSRRVVGRGGRSAPAQPRPPPAPRVRPPLTHPPAPRTRHAARQDLEAHRHSLRLVGALGRRGRRLRRVRARVAAAQRALQPRPACGRGGRAARARGLGRSLTLAPMVGGHSPAGRPLPARCALASSTPRETSPPHHPQLQNPKTHRPPHLMGS